MKFLDKILYKIARRLFRKYLNELVQEHVSEIVKRPNLVIDIVDKYFDFLEDRKTKMYINVLVGEVHAETDDEAVEKTERIIREYYERIEEIEKVRRGFHSILWTDIVVDVSTKLATLLTLFMFLRGLIDAIKELPSLEVEKQCTP